MSELLDLALQAHGDRGRWPEVQSLGATWLHDTEAKDNGHEIQDLRAVPALHPMPALRF